jgi:ferredoxin
MKVMVDTDLCEANAICVAQCPDVFRVNDDDTLTILVSEVPAASRVGVEEAVRLCPRQALKVDQ